MTIVTGAFEGFQGELLAVDEEHDKVTIGITIFGRRTSVELERWEVERKRD